MRTSLWDVVGWRNRQQFEVTWVTLQGLLSPPEPLDELPAEEAVEFHKVTCIALRAITSLLIQTTLLPTPGYPAVSRLWHVSRQKELPFLGSRYTLYRLYGVEILMCGYR